MSTGCPRCSASLIRGIGCLAHGEPPPAPETSPGEDDASPVGGKYSEAEKAFVREHLCDMSYIDIAAALGRTAKGIEALVRSQGWNKQYVRKGDVKARRAPFAIGTPADSLLAGVLRSRAREGWAVSVATLATITGLAEPTVYRALGRMERRGIIHRQRRRDGWWGDRPSIITWLGPGFGSLKMRDGGGLPPPGQGAVSDGP